MADQSLHNASENLTATVDTAVSVELAMHVHIRPRFTSNTRYTLKAISHA